MGLYDAYDRNAHNVILTDGEGHVTEGPGFNIFVLRGHRATTPARGILEGITRQTAAELLTEMGIETDRRPVSVEELETADEIFITSTAGGIMAVTTVDGRPIANGKMGAITRELTVGYWQAHGREGWCVSIEDAINSPNYFST